jgi:Uma2 family endonuclease
MSVQMLGKQQTAKKRTAVKKHPAMKKRTQEFVYVPELILPTEDNQNLESSWHRSQINLFIESIQHQWRDRTDFYVGGNMFVYYDLPAAARKRHSRGPDFYVALDVDGTFQRGAWVVWEEAGRYPNLIIELLSPSTAESDRTTKKHIYEQTFRTPEYIWYFKDTDEFVGWRLGKDGHYEPIEPNEHGWLWSEQLGLWVGRWQGTYLGEKAIWIRFYDPEGNLVLLPAEAEKQRAETEKQRAETEKQRAEAEKQRAETEKQRAETEKQRAEAEKQRADAAEAELERLKTRLKELGDETE